MSGEAVAVRFSDGLVLWSYYASVSDTIAWLLVAELWNAEKYQGCRDCTCGAPAEAVELAMDGLGWFGTACRTCMCIVSHNDPWPTDDHGGCADPKIKPHDEPAWRRVELDRLAPLWPDDPRPGDPTPAQSAALAQVAPVRQPVTLPLWPRPNGEAPMVVLGLCHGDWAAFDKPGALNSSAASWTVCHVPTGLYLHWDVVEAVALEAARLMAQALPGWPDVVDGVRLADLDDAAVLVMAALSSGGRHEAANREAAVHRVTREAFRAAWECPGSGVRDRALSKRPARAARPFVVTISRSANLLVFAESEDAVQAALESKGRDPYFFDRFLSEADLDVTVGVAGAAEAARECKVSRSARGNVHADNYFWALDHRLYEAESAPAQLYLEPRPTDHGHQCPAKSRGSAFGEVEPGECTCQVGVFPPPPAPVPSDG